MTSMANGGIAYFVPCLDLDECAIGIEREKIDIFHIHHKEPKQS
jgi:hypothetical protein